MTEEDRVPSIGALHKHWSRSWWIHQMWYSSNVADVYGQLPPPENYGWINEEIKYNIEWMPEEERNCIGKKINYLMKGCGCKTGCISKRCGCRKEGRLCGPGVYRLCKFNSNC